jgi:hypothetical protein
VRCGGGGGRGGEERGVEGPRDEGREEERHGGEALEQMRAQGTYTGRGESPRRLRNLAGRAECGFPGGRRRKRRVAVSGGEGMRDGLSFSNVVFDLVHI